ncbi:hypothetical protein BZZ01_01890 [Nostocales cyanobacterium HT-58-2]|nr:hypothetical protein BZZ01_01890 [Nostocales cyanobacterium HT-58-2]
MHAQEELTERNIPLQVLELVLNQPEQIVDEDNLKVYQGRFEAANRKTYLLRAYVNDQVNPIRVVTVYRTSKINKYLR